MHRMEKDRASSWVQDLPWPTVAARIAAGAIALLPIGAASKEHGPHLPHGTDYVQAGHYAAHIATEVDALIWPVVAYGYYPAFTDYPGSVSLREVTFIALIEDILAGIVASGVQRIALINTGISTIPPLTKMIATPPTAAIVDLVNCYHGPRFSAASAAVQEQQFGGHADEIETSLMLAIAPERVVMDQAVAATAPVLRGTFNRLDPGAPNYSPSGVNGDPTRATRVKGELLLAALYADIVAAVQALANACGPIRVDNFD